MQTDNHRAGDTAAPDTAGQTAPDTGNSVSPDTAGQAAPNGRLIDLTKIIDPRGNLTVAERDSGLPFDIGRVYWVYDVPSGESRGGHAHRECEELLVAVSGSFDVTLDNGHQRQTYHLNHPWQGLYIGTDTWRTLDDFSSGAVCLVIASQPFREEDYVRNYETYKLQIKN